MLVNIYQNLISIKDFFLIFKIAIDIDNEAKEHNHFLKSMVIRKIEFNRKQKIFYFILEFRFRYST
jgi:hypothetical protein